MDQDLLPDIQPSTSASAAVSSLAHDYAVLSSPRKMKRKLNLLEERTQKFKKRLNTARRQKSRLRKKVETMQQVIAELQERNLVSYSCADLLRSTCSTVPLELFNRISKSDGEKPSRSTYHPALKSFALTLQFYSTKTYEYVRKTFNLELPHISTIRKWYSSLNGDPGFTSEVFTSLSQKVKESDDKVLVSLMLDEMAIRKAIEVVNGKVVGHVDIGQGPVDDQAPPASNALVLMVVCMNGRWKVPVGYFLVNGVSAAEKAEIVTQCLVRLHETGVVVVSLTCDGPSSHISMIQKLGAQISHREMQPNFPHPVDPSHRIHVMLDPCHMIKLVRNWFSQSAVLYNSDRAAICWKYVCLLEQVQKEKGVHLANKLRERHIYWRPQVQKVNVCVQTISNSVATAIDFCRENLEMVEFKGSEATTEFLRLFDHLFDVMNSRNPLCKNQKAPLRVTNECLWRPFLHRAETYIRTLTLTDGRPAIQSHTRTGFIGFISCAHSVAALFDTYVKPADSPLKYLLTYKMSQDHLELFFAAVRSRGGHNNNPTPRQFSAAYKRLLMRHEIASSGNCTAVDKTSVLSISSEIDRVVKDNLPPDERDRELINRYGLLDSSAECSVECEAIPDMRRLDKFVDSAVTYMAGFVSRHLGKKLGCLQCKASLTTIDASTRDLIAVKDMGGLTRPSPSVVRVCEASESVIRLLLAATGGKVPRVDGITSAIETCVVAKLGRLVFSELNTHMLDTEPENNHVFDLIRSVCRHYVTIRFHHAAKLEVDSFTKKRIRKVLTKLILFNHQ